MTEAEWIRRALAGDDNAYAELVARHQEGVFRLAYLLTGDADEAGDIAQETFIAAHRALPRFDPSRPMRPWLLRIAANRAHNRRRTWRRHIAAAYRWGAQRPLMAATAEADGSAHLEAQALWGAVQRLSADDQAVIYLRFFLELSVEETAQTLVVAEGTVKSRLSRALRRLRAVIDHEFPLLTEGRAHE